MSQTMADPAVAEMVTTRDHMLSEAATIDERIVVAPCEGRFRFLPAEHFTAEGEYVIEGQVIGVVVSTNGKEVDVVTPFSGWVMDFMIKDGWPVVPSEPILWLRPL
ncbi:MAG TPA: hypothetical protein VND22_04375 [Actinomycetota bacterium]|nr:hypothetical protein [Actinomycetota bacterium]